jgi:hypothetical protein
VGNLSSSFEAKTVRASERRKGERMSMGGVLGVIHVEGLGMIRPIFKAAQGQPDAVTDQLLQMWILHQKDWR